MSPEKIISRFGLSPSDFVIAKTGSGHINHTFKLLGPESYILQRVNNSVFVEPEIIAGNIKVASDYLKMHFPDYVFLTSIPSQAGEDLVYDEDGFPWRMFPLIEDAFTVDQVENIEQAQSAATAFATLARNLSGVDCRRFRETIPRFHDLSFRYRQFEQAIQNAERDAIDKSDECINSIRQNHDLVLEYETLTKSNSVPLRVMHNDTKINNVLFDKRTGKAVCVIDLDTLMPGYFFYDFGDMIRTFVSPVSEEEQNLDLIVVRDDIRSAVEQCYLKELEPVLTKAELQCVSFSGPMMTYIMAIRFLKDFLDGNKYFQTTYPEQNLTRAQNQIRLLQLLRR